ncbi:NHL domain-containing protein [Anthocerotibacter panamensis]|uniref:NHL domain-containing protein n=1 Tax=Anthocerotibacter panamensis TaxID=2857077 RepID=UPI001C406111|nr:hypothetical protein [Anthocerotibacter panamensis]
MDTVRYVCQLFLWSLGICLVGINVLNSFLEKALATGADAPNQFSAPVALVKTQDDLFLVDHDHMRVLALDNQGTVRPIAGSGSLTASGDGGPALQAGMYALGLARDRWGNLYVADHGNHRIRRIDPKGRISTFAGTGKPGFSGDGGRAAAAQLNNPVGVAVDAQDNLYLTDYANHRLRRVDAQGQMTTLAGTGRPGFSPDGTPALAADLNSPWAVTLDCAGRVLFTDLGSQSVKRLDRGKIVTVMKGLGRPTGLAVDCSQGETVYVSDVTLNQVLSFSGGVKRVVAGLQPKSLGDGKPALQAELSSPYALTVDALGQLWIADTNHNRIRIIDRNGFITTVLAGQPG